ncbi:hypothetical protein [Xenorhabdus nematophila]|uniref:hypothetical protein n=1 Tax=Xenorhabdus nematophila TaxID=628 RepID=UPI0030D9AE36
MVAIQTGFAIPGAIVRRGRSLPHLNRHRKGERRHTGRNILPVDSSTGLQIPDHWILPMAGLL